MQRTERTTATIILKQQRTLCSFHVVLPRDPQRANVACWKSKLCEFPSWSEYLMKGR